MSDDRYAIDETKEPPQSKDVLADLLFLGILGFPLICWGDGDDQDEEEDE